MIKVESYKEIPKNLTRVVEYSNGTKAWYKNGELHREDGPAIEWPDGYKAWHLEEKEYNQLSLKDYVVLDYYQGKYNLMWYKLLDKDKIIEHPDIPGLINQSFF